MSTTGGPVDAERPAFLNPVTLVGEAIRAIISRLPESIYIWLASSLGLAVADFAAQGRELQVKSLDMSALDPAWAVAALFGGGVSAIFMRLLLAGRDGWLSLDWRLLQCAGLLALGQLLPAAAADLAAGGRGVPIDPHAQLYLLCGRLAAGLAAWYVSAKLLLWPVDRLAGRTDLTPEQSWRLMRRTLRSLVLAWLLIGIPDLLAEGSMKALRLDPESLPPVLHIANICLGAATGLILDAVIVAIYRRRVGGERISAERGD